MIQCGAEGAGRKQRDGRWEALRLSTKRIHPKGEFISDDFKLNCRQVGCFVELFGSTIHMLRMVSDRWWWCSS
jgi:hypothetical protein